MRPTIVAALLSLVSGLGAWPADAAWMQIRRDNVLVLSDASAADLRRTFDRLQQFREVIGAAFPSAVTTAPVPTIVVVFRSTRAMRAYTPALEGHVVRGVPGYFQAGDDLNYMALTAEPGADGLRLMFHEYAHFVIRNTAGQTPAWFSEGVAQLYETLAVTDDSSGAIIGIASAEHVRLLQSVPLMPLAELMQVDTSLRVYEDDRRRQLFYAQSWALAHYLLLGPGAHAGQFDDYLARLRRGEPLASAFTSAFAMTEKALEQALRAYVRRLRFPALGFRFASRAAEPRVDPAQPVGDSDVQAYLADLLARAGRVTDARARLTALLGEQPQNARAAAVLGALHLRESRVDDALPLLERAATRARDDAWIQATWGAALYEQAVRQPDATREERTRALQHVHTVLTHAASLDPLSAPTFLRLAFVDMAVNENLPRALELAARALRLAPARIEDRRTVAQWLLRQRDAGRIRHELASAIERGYVELAEIERIVASSPDGVTHADAADLADGMRRAKDGERRVFGRLDAMECGPLLRVYVIALDAGRLELFEQPGATDLRTRRQASSAFVECGHLLRPLPVVAVYRPIDEARPDQPRRGVAVAITLVPDDFVLRQP